MGKANEKVKTMAVVNSYHNEQSTVEISVDYASNLAKITAINTSFDAIRNVITQTQAFNNQNFAGESVEEILEFKGWVEQFHADLDDTLKEYKELIAALNQCESDISGDARRMEWINQ